MRVEGKGQNRGKALRSTNYHVNNKLQEYIAESNQKN